MSTIWANFKSYFWAICIVPILPILKYVTPLVTLLGLAFSSGDLVDSFISLLNGLSAQVANAPATSAIAIVNRIIPLSEGLAMFATLFSLQATAMMVRFVMRFLPGGR